MTKRCVLAAWLLPAAVFALAALRVTSLPRLEAGSNTDESTRMRISNVVRQREPAMRRSTLERWPADPWSQADDFGNLERRLLRELAARERVSISFALEAIDEDIRTRPLDDPRAQTTRAGVVPCMPRPFYN